MKRILLVAAIFALAALSSHRAMAVAQRTFVSGGGNDANVCSIVAPCRSFAAALAQTLANGEIVVLDSAGYGTVVIAQSVSIVAPPGIYAGITVFSGETGVRISGPGIKVALRGLQIHGLSGSGYGIRYVQGSVLHVDQCVISGVVEGLSIEGAGEINVQDSVLHDSGQGVTVRTVTNPAVANVTLDRLRIRNISAFGVSVIANARVLVRDCVISGSNGGVGSGGPDPGDYAFVIVENSTMIQNLYFGVFAGNLIPQNGQTQVIVTNSTLAWNGSGWEVANNANTELYSRGNNTVRFNTTNQAGKSELVIAPN